MWRSSWGERNMKNYKKHENATIPYGWKCTNFEDEKRP
jgi:hypothetical protein